MIFYLQLFHKSVVYSKISSPSLTTIGVIILLVYFKYPSNAIRFLYQCKCSNVNVQFILRYKKDIEILIRKIRKKTLKN